MSLFFGGGVDIYKLYCSLYKSVARFKIGLRVLQTTHVCFLASCFCLEEHKSGIWPSYLACYENKVVSWPIWFSWVKKNTSRDRLFCSFCLFPTGFLWGTQYPVFLAHNHIVSFPFLPLTKPPKASAPPAQSRHLSTSLTTGLSQRLIDPIAEERDHVLQQTDRWSLYQDLPKLLLFSIVVFAF